MYSRINFGIGTLMSLLILAGLCRGADSPAEGQKTFTAEQFTRKTIYHSPQKPGYTCWVGAWIAADKSLMVAFDQATGSGGTWWCKISPHA